MQNKQEGQPRLQNTVSCKEIWTVRDLAGLGLNRLKGSLVADLGMKSMNKKGWQENWENKEKVNKVKSLIIQPPRNNQFTFGCFFQCCVCMYVSENVYMLVCVPMCVRAYM